MGGMKLSELDFVRLLPAFMREDAANIALSKAMDKLFKEPGARLDTLRTWDKIDELTEDECDALAWELDVDWYDSTGMKLEEKRETLKLAQQIKRKRGTKWAVDRLISAYFGEGFVTENDEIGGTPFAFTVYTTNPEIVNENYNKFVEAIKAAKNERSHIAGVYYLWPQGPENGVECALDSGLHRYDYPKAGTYPHIHIVGVGKRAEIATTAATSPTVYNYRKCGTERCQGKNSSLVGYAIVGHAVVGG